MDQAFQRYVRFHRAEGHSPKTIQYHRDSLERSFFPFLLTAGKSLSLDELTADAVLDWVDDQRSRGLAQKTVSTRVVSIKAFCKWLVAEDWLPKDPLARFKVPKVDDKPKQTLTPANIDTLIAACNRKTPTGCRDYAILLLLFSTGLRASEVVGLQTADLDWSHGLITIQRGKGGKARVVPLGDKVAKALERYLSHPKRSDSKQPPHAGRSDSPHVFLNNRRDPLPYRGLVAILTRLERRTGVHCNPHLWRHSAAITYLRNGGRVETLRSLLGHTTLAMSLHYARIAGVDLVAAHETADPTRSLKTRG